MRVLILTNCAEAHDIAVSTENRKNKYDVLVLPKDTVECVARLSVELHNDLLKDETYDLVVYVDSAVGGYACNLGDFAVPRCIMLDDDVSVELSRTFKFSPICFDIDDEYEQAFLNENNGNVVLMCNASYILRVCQLYEYDLMVIGRIDSLPQFGSTCEDVRPLSLAVDFIENTIK